VNGKKFLFLIRHIKHLSQLVDGVLYFCTLLFGWFRVPHVYKSDQKQKLLTIHEPRGYSLLFGWLRVPHVYQSDQKQKLLAIHEPRGYSLLFGWFRVPHVYKSDQKQKLLTIHEHRGYTQNTQNTKK
jgi:hypothetical protein